MMVKFVIILISNLALFAAAVMHMEVQPDTKRCIGQELDEEDYAVFSMSAVHSRKDTSHVKQTLIATVEDPAGTQLVAEKIKLGGKPREEQLSISERGVYDLCFELQDGETPVRVSFDIMFKDREVDEIKRLQRGNIPVLEYQLKLAEESMQEIIYEIDFAKRQEIILREAGETTAARIQWFSILSVVILLTTSLWQIIYLRYFFQSKKLL